MKYQKKPIQVEARQVTGDTMMDVYQWIEHNTVGSFEPMAVIDGDRSDPTSGVSIDPRDGRLMIATLEGVMRANLGDYVICGVEGEFYPVAESIFEATYEAVTGDETV